MLIFMHNLDLLTPTFRTSFATGSAEEASYSSFQREVSPVRSAVESVAYIADHLKNEEDDKQVIEDWKYISVVMDRVFLILFTCACALGTILIIARAPSIYDTTPPLA
ncbi:unnamed protein product [Cylicostephanus goldi]|uniref:Neurotransmitter-gated ion-channel transmembrane domain-containing protein n=1 Tax=Cylicostephanus goldi TaxID=71465 RepID=A0A3P6QM96_CYLGO|nr:unnamed protein product [Cylicostephanus goldi]